MGKQLINMFLNTFGIVWTDRLLEPFGPLECERSTMQRAILKTNGIPEVLFLETGMDQILNIYFAGIQYDGKLRYIVRLATTDHD